MNREEKLELALIEALAAIGRENLVLSGSMVDMVATMKIVEGWRALVLQRPPEPTVEQWDVQRIGNEYHITCKSGSAAHRQPLVPRYSGVFLAIVGAAPAGYVSIDIDDAKRVATVMAAAPALIHAIKAAEWGANVDLDGGGTASGCPVCEATKQSGAHADGCPIRTALRLAGAE